ncbi:MAG: acyl-CoA dehydrogenase family protein [Myxococcota bacterium]|nr:acyl-CoA dehydrogenase family protein [Myxococcota bacterium]
MYIDLTPEQRQLRDDLRSYLDQLLTDELQAELEHSEGGGPEYYAAMAKLGADGWLGLGWPKAYGGQERPAIEQFIFFDEVQRAGFPIPILTLNTVGPTLASFGTDAQREAYLPGILAGKTHFSIGYTEPNAGTDLASLTTTAVRDGDEWVINGQKIWTSLAGHADYIWLACRTNPDVPKHKGISLIIVPTSAEGFSKTPMNTLGGNETFTCYYDNVRVPYDNVVGGENNGWKLITTQLNHERVALVAVGPLKRFNEEVLAWAKEIELTDGRTLADEAWVQANLAKCHAHLEVLKLFNWRQAQNIEAGELNPAEASCLKVFGSELFIDGYRLLMQVLGESGHLKKGSAGAALQGRIERYYRAIMVLTFGGGTNEVQRDIISMVGLGMPRAR